jgi:hypothetical protein
MIYGMSLDEAQPNFTSIVGGYWVPLELPIDLDEVHRSTGEVMVDSLTPRGAKNQNYL